MFKKSLFSLVALNVILIAALFIVGSPQQADAQLGRPKVSPIVAFPGQMVGQQSSSVFVLDPETTILLGIGIQNRKTMQVIAAYELSTDIERAMKTFTR